MNGSDSETDEDDDDSDLDEAPEVNAHYRRENTTWAARAVGGAGVIRRLNRRPNVDRRVVRGIMDHGPARHWLAGHPQTDCRASRS